MLDPPSLTFPMEYSTPKKFFPNKDFPHRNPPQEHSSPPLSPKKVCILPITNSIRKQYANLIAYRPLPADCGEGGHFHLKDIIDCSFNHTESNGYLKFLIG